MKFLSLFRSKPKIETIEPPPSEHGCPHALLAPRWDNVQDIGHEDRAVGYACTTCGQQLSLEEAATIRKQGVVNS